MGLPSTTDGMGYLRGKIRLGCLEVCLLISIAALAAQLLADPVHAWLVRPRPGRQVPARARLGGYGEVQYLIYLPQDYPAATKWPLLVHLHGSGEAGDDIETVSRLGPPALIERGKQFPMIVVSPQCRANAAWDSQQLLALLEQLQGRFSVDPDRVYVSGYSRGSYGTWKLICAAPERFAAAVPVAGGGNADEADKLINLPIWAFHGARDKTIPPEESQKMVDAVQAAGGNARLTVLEDQGHGICDLVFSRDDLYEWLLEQRRQVEAKGGR